MGEVGSRRKLAKVPDEEEQEDSGRNEGAMGAGGGSWLSSAP